MDAACRRFVPRVLTIAVTLTLLVAAVRVPALSAQIRVNPTGVNVNVQGATTVFLSFGGLNGFVPVEATWCGELVPAAPAIGLRCAPGSVFGQLPARFDVSRASGVNGFTDIMTIPASVARRAYQAATAGANSAFFYVRRFRDPAGGADQYVAVTCRLTGGGARTPLAITDVRIVFRSDAPVLQVATGETVPAIDARITYTGTGRLAGRWEIVMPGEELPTRDDLLTEASLPLELRGRQRRYAQLSRFNVFLPPTGTVVLPAPDPGRFPTNVDGIYHLLLRIEATPDKEGDSNLGAAGAGDGIAHSGAVAGFPMPVLRYVVGSGAAAVEGATPSENTLALLEPRPDTRLDSAAVLRFHWRPVRDVAVYRLEAEGRSGGDVITVGALVDMRATHYDAPEWFRQRLGAATVRWRITALDGHGRRLARSAWWTFHHDMASH